MLPCYPLPEPESLFQPKNSYPDDLWFTLVAMGSRLVPINSEHMPERAFCIIYIYIYIHILILYIDIYSYIQGVFYRLLSSLKGPTSGSMLL